MLVRRFLYFLFIFAPILTLSNQNILFILVLGEAFLSKNDSGLIRKSSGDVIFHAPYDRHSMMTKEKSVLVCWVNSGDTFGEYYFC